MQRRHLLQGAGLTGLHALAGSHTAAAWAAPAPAPAAPAARDTRPYDWQSVPFGAGGFVNGFVWHPREAGLLYARTDVGGAYRFDPAGQAWVPLLDHLGRADADLMGVLSLALDPAEPDRVYAACGLYTGEWSRQAALLASTDRGASWQVHELGFKLGGNEPGRGSGERLQVDPNLGDVLFLGTTRNGLWRSADRGRRFERLGGFAPQHASLVLVDPRSGMRGSASRTVYAGSHDQPGLYVSQDGGQSFSREPGTPAQAPQRTAFGPDGTLYVSFALGRGQAAPNPGNAHTGSVWKRDAAGRWSEITPVKPGGHGFGYSGLDVDARVPGRLVVATIERWGEGDEVFLSTDAGSTWTPLGKRSRHDTSSHPWLASYMRGEDRMGHWISDLKLDPQDGRRMVYGTGYGLWMTEALDAPQVPWAFTVANLEETAPLEVRSPSGGATLLAAMGDVGGGAWDRLDRTPVVGLFAPTSETNRSVDVAELNPGIIARTADQAPTGGYWSSNGGASWRPFGPSARAARRPDGGHADAGTIAVSAKGGFFVWAPAGQAALQSSDHGKTWKEVTGWPTARDVKLAPVADRMVEGVFYVHDRANGRVLVSTDGGLQFGPAITGLPLVAHWQSAQLVCAPGRLRDLWLALPEALVHFPGADQPPLTLKPVAEPWMIALGKGAPGAAYHSLYVWGRVQVKGAAVAEGLFRSDDAGASFQRVNDDGHRYGRLLSMAADPLEHGIVYLAPHGRGVLVGKPRARS